VRLRSAVSVVAVALAAGGTWAGAAGAPEAAGRAAAWVESRQQPSGAFFDADAQADGVAETLAALAAAGVSGDAVDRALGYLERRGPQAAQGGGKTGRIVMGLVASARDPRSFGGVDYVAKLRSFYNATTGAYDPSTVYADALAVLGVIASGERLPNQAPAYLRANQCATGGFSWRTGCAGTADVDTTTAVLSALVAAGAPASDLGVTRARTFLQQVQNADGGFGLEPGQPTNANSTGLALSAIAALGEDAGAPPWRRPDGPTPLGALLALQQPSGAFRFTAAQADDNPYATVQAIPGLAGAAYPIRPTRAARAQPVPVPPVRPEARSRVAASPVRAGGGPAERPMHHAAVIAGTKAACVAFAEPQIDGYELLSRAGFSTTQEPFAQGRAICSIDGSGCTYPKDRCWCRYPAYWRYWTRDDGDSAWRFSDLGPGARLVRDGSIDAWMWTSSTDAPALRTAQDVCAAQPAVTASAARRAVTGATRAGDATGYAGFAALAAAIAAAGAVVVVRRRAA
jgi:hypothetical protein